MNRLLQIGFEPAGHWLLEQDKLKVELSRHSTQKNILYAFVCDGQVMYVGKTVCTLSARMSGYRSPGRTQTTNIKNHQRIRKLLSNNVAVEILALPDSGLLHFGQFHLNLAAALEDNIIKVIDPPWNGGKIEDTTDAPVTETAESASELLAAQTFTFTLRPTYVKTGFFNVGVAAEQYIGEDGETIELFLGNESLPILGTINRRVNSNRTPRVMGGSVLGTGSTQMGQSREVLACKFSPLIRSV